MIATFARYVAAAVLYRALVRATEARLPLPVCAALGGAIGMLAGKADSPMSPSEDGSGVK